MVFRCPNTEAHKGKFCLIFIDVNVAICFFGTLKVRYVCLQTVQ